MDAATKTRNPIGSRPPKYGVSRLHRRLEIILDDASEGTKNATTLLLTCWENLRSSNVIFVFLEGVVGSRDYRI